MMGMNWHNYEHEWQRRRKNATEKRIWRDVRLTKDGNDVFHLDYTPRVWRQQANGKYAAVREAGYKLATITPDNVLTLLYERTPDLTVCNRLSYIIGRSVWSDTSHHRNKEHKIRIRPAVWNRAKSEYEIDSWYPTGVSTTNWAHGTIPYKAGLMFQLDSLTGNPNELLTPVEDVSVLVKNEAIQRAKADTKVMRVLVRGMARMGVFDEQLRTKLDRGWLHGDAVPKRMEDVNYKQPLGDDAAAVFIAGLMQCTTPAHSHYVNGTWTRRSDEDRYQAAMSAAIDNGMKLLRKHIYKTTDGYERRVK